MSESDQHDDLLSALYDLQLPTGVPVLPSYDLAARFVLPPSDSEPSGSWFDVVALDSGRTALVVGDVAETGLAGAAAVGQVRSVLRASLAHFGDVVAALEVADTFARLTPAVRGAAVVVAVLDPSSASLSYCTAGHPAPVLVRSEGRGRVLEPTGSATLGSGAGYTCHEVSLGAGDVVLLHTLDVTGDAGGDTAVLSVAEGALAAARAAGRREAEALCDTLLGLAPGDDVPSVLLAAQVRRQPLAELDLDLPAGAETVGTARAALTEWLRGLDVSPLDVMSVEHAVAELVTNASEHAYAGEDTPGTVGLRARLAPDGTAGVEVLDAGRWRRTSSDRSRGRGLAMAAGLVDDLAVHPGPDGTRVVVRHRLARPVPLGEGTAPRDLALVRAVEVEREGFGTVALRGVFGHEDVERVTTEMRLASQACTRDLDLDLSQVTRLSTGAVRLLREAVLAERVGHLTTRVVLHAGAETPGQRALERARLPYVTTTVDV